MASGRSVLISVLSSLLATVLLTTTTSSQNTQTTTPTVVQVELQYVGNGICKQKIVGTSNSTPFVPIGANEIVRWSTANSMPFQVNFRSSLSPFKRNQFPSTTGAAVDSDPAHGTMDTQYPYSSVTIGNNNCNLVPGPLGLIMK